MLTRPGSTPGSGWIRGVSERLASAPADTQSPPRRFWAAYFAFVALVLVILPLVQRRALQSYVLAIGGIAIGVIAVGGLAAGGIAIGGVSLGLLAFAGLAIGWRAVGGCAVGFRAFGGLAFGGYAYAGNGVAFGYHEACGRQKEKLFG